MLPDKAIGHLALIVAVVLPTLRYSATTTSEAEKRMETHTHTQRSRSPLPRQIHYAGLWPRFLALVADGLLFCACFFPITRAVKGVWIMSPSDHRWVGGLWVTDPLCIAFLIVILLYFVGLEGLAGATFGKWLVGLRVSGRMAAASPVWPEVRCATSSGWWMGYRR